MGNKYVKRCPILVEIREMQLKIIRLTLQPSDSPKLESWMILCGGAGLPVENVKEPSLKHHMVVLGNKLWMQIMDFHIAVTGNVISRKESFPLGN